MRRSDATTLAPRRSARSLAATVLTPRRIGETRPPALMPVTWVEKLSFGIPAIVLFAQGRISESMLGAGLLDLVLGAAFVMAYFKTPPRAA